MPGYDGLNPLFASRVQALINASGGLLKPGSGFRTPEQQAQLRITNGCPDQYRSPAGACRVPTAIPGRSMHNHGLAMDLVDARTGQAVKSGSPADKWLAANAANFGLHRPVGHPGGKGWEPWHVELINDDEAGSHIQGAMSAGGYGTDMSWMDENRTPEDELRARLDSVRSALGFSPPEPGGPMNDVGTKVGQTAPKDNQVMGATMGGEPLEPGGLGDIPPPGYVPPGRGVERWRSVAESALRYVGEPTDPGTVNMLLRRMAKESGGNPEAVNHWDSNAKRGDPTTGLMQNIPSAFTQRAGELAGRGITDGFANIVAALRYTKQRYGSLAKGFTRPGGY